MSVRRLIGEGANPYGGIDQNHQAARRLREGFSRRLGTSCASGSVPRSLRIRSYAAWRTSASNPMRIASVSVAAPHAPFASFRSLASILSVFFIHISLPYMYGQENHTCVSVRRIAISTTLGASV